MQRNEPRPHFTLVFDGGSRGNPGFGYGSYRLEDQEGRGETIRLEYGDNVTNNQAEYRTLIEGLNGALAEANKRGARPKTVRLTIRSDSKLVIEQVLGRWQVKNLELQLLCKQARSLISRFGDVDLAWQPRASTVRVLGH